MTDILPFRSREALSARANLDNFIRQAREELTAFGADLHFDSNTWDISEQTFLPAFPSATFKLHFRQWKQPSRMPYKPMREPFCSFAKAFITLRILLSAGPEARNFSAASRAGKRSRYAFRPSRSNACNP